MGLRFVVHEHHASRLHFDFRLEWQGVLRSWAIPKGPSMSPSEKRLAVLVEDHPLEYIDFEGIIPKGQYGAGVVLVWDAGPYEPIEWGDNKITFILHGEKLKGAFSLTRMRGGKTRGNEWLLIKGKDELSRNDWKLEVRLTPQLEAQLAERIPPCATS